VGSAQLAHHELRGLAGRLTDTAMLIQDELGVRAMHLAQAESSASYDASEDRSTVDDRIASLERERSGLVSRRDELSALIGSKRDRADELSDRSSALRQESAVMRLEAESLDYGESRVALVKRAVETGREADALAREAAGLRSEVSNLEPTLDRVGREVRRVESQLDSSRETLDRIAEMASDRRDRARGARAEAGASAETIRGRIGGLVALVTGEFDETMVRVGSRFDSALSSVSSASRAGARDEARAGRGVIEHASYVAHVEAAEALSVAVKVLENAREAGIEVAGLEDVRSRRDSAREKAEAMRTSAMSSLGSSGVRGEAGDGLSRLAESLERPSEGESVEESGGAGEGEPSEG